MSNVTLRTKTIDALTARAEKIGMKAEELIQKVTADCNDFCKLTEEEARRYLLLLKITPPKKVEEPVEEATETEKADTKPKREKLSLEKVLEDGELLEIGVENATKVCGDLAAAYKAAHPDCWLNKKDEYPEELRKALLDDATILYVIRDKCKEAAFKGDAAISRILFLTSSDVEKNRFGGLMSLDFGYNLAMYVKDHAKLICDYFKTFLEDREPSNGLPIPEGVVFPTEAPEAPKKAVKATKQQKSNKEVAETAQTTETQSATETPAAEAVEKTVAIPTKPAKPAKKLDTHKVINRLGDVRSFLFLADKLRKAGIDPVTLLEKEDGVNAMINNMVKAMGEI